MKRKRKIRAMKARRSMLNRPIICKIEIEDSGQRVMKYEGGIKKGFLNFKNIFFDVYQFKEEEKNGTKSKQKKQV